MKNGPLKHLNKGTR